MVKDTEVIMDMDMVTHIGIGDIMEKPLHVSMVMVPQFHVLLDVRNVKPRLRQSL